MGRSFCVSMIGDSFLLRQRAVLHEAKQIAERLLFYKDRADFLIGGDGILITLRFRPCFMPAHAIRMRAAD